MTWAGTIEYEVAMSVKNNYLNIPRGTRMPLCAFLEMTRNIPHKKNKGEVRVRLPDKIVREEFPSLPKLAIQAPVGLLFNGTPACWMNECPSGLSFSRKRVAIMQQRLMHMRYEDFDCLDHSGQSKPDEPEETYEEWEAVVKHLFA